MVVNYYKRYNEKWTLKRWAFAGPRMVELCGDGRFNIFIARRLYPTVAAWWLGTNKYWK